MSKELSIDVTDLGFETRDELMATLERAKNANAGQEQIEKIMADLTENVKGLSESVRQVVNAQEENLASDLFDAASASKLVEQYKALPDNDPNKQAIRETLSNEFGNDAAELALSGSSLKKLIERPVSTFHKNREEIVAAQKSADNAYLLTAIRGGLGGSENKPLIDKNIYVNAVQNLKNAGDFGAEFLTKGINEALDTATATEGLEWIPTNMSNQMLEDIYLQLQIAGVFRRFPMPTKTYELPMRTARAKGYRVPESLVYTDFFVNKFTAHNLETAKVTFAAKKLGCLNFASAELEEDAALTILDMLKEEVAWGLASCIDDAALNGSTGATLDGALWSGTTDARSAWDGIRTSIAAAQKVDLSTVNTNAIANLRKTMGKYGMYSDDLVLFVSPSTAVELTKLDQVLTVDKYGANASILKGEIARIFNIPIIPSEYVYTNLNNSGVYDGVTTDKTIMVLCHRKGFGWGDRRMVRIETDRQMLSEQRAIASSWRGDFQSLFESSVETAALGYKIS